MIEMERQKDKEKSKSPKILLEHFFLEREGWRGRDRERNNINREYNRK
jgi:hypothetical protein